jgi:hypothetical protein
MKVKQISVFLENKAGRLADATRVLGDNHVNIRALSIADTTDFGVLRMIVDQPDKATKVLKDNGFTVAETDVIAVEVPDCPGGLAGILDVLKNKGISVEYLYCFVDKDRQAAVNIMRVERADEAIQNLQAAGVCLIKAEELYRL